MRTKGTALWLSIHAKKFGLSTKIQTIGTKDGSVTGDSYTLAEDSSSV